MRTPRTRPSRSGRGAPAPRRATGTCAILAVLFLAGSRIGSRDGPTASDAPGEAPWDLEVPAPLPGPYPAALDGLDALTCTRCHADIVEEWAGTLHAMSWIDEIYHEALEGRRRPESCHGCHIPEPLHQVEMNRKPPPRSVDLHFGVSCDTCHLGEDGVLLGPFGIETEAHPSAKSETFLGSGTNAICIACHSTNIGPVIGIAKDFELSELPEDGKTCVSCHMAPTERTLPSHDPTEPAPERTETRPGRSHALQTPRDPSFLRRAFELSFEIDGDRSVLTVANRAGHRVPGLIGRKIVFEVESRDAQGAVIAEGVLEIDHRHHLPLQGRRELSLEGAAASLRVVGIHEDPRLADPVRFMEEDLEP